MTPSTITLAVDGCVHSVAPGSPVTIGRGVEADIRIDHPQVSRRHAELAYEPGAGWVLRDLGSSNGIFVDGQRVAALAVWQGCHVMLGPSVEARVLRVGEPGIAGLPDVGVAERDGTDVPGSGQARPVRSGQETPTGKIVSDRSGSGVVTIGRAPDNSVVADDLLVSRHHAQATPEGDGFRIEDLGSRNGTYVNGARVRAARIGPTDLLAIGHLEFRVVDGHLVMQHQRTEVSLVVSELSTVLPNGKPLLQGVNFTLPESSLLAVIGPSGAGKTTLLNALTGVRRATSGWVLVDGRDLYEDFPELRHRIGVVPQDDVVHTQLTVRQALGYASQLRFPADLDRDARLARIDEVVRELELDDHIDTRIDKLSGGQRKRTSVALELLTEPSLLFLDEPTSGLDPALDRSVMKTLRGLADGGRTVVVITHSVANLGLCDRVLLLAPGGRVAFYGRPGELLGYFGRTDYSDVFADVTAHPEKIAAEYARRAPRPGTRPGGPLVSPLRSADRAAEPLRRQRVSTQIATLIRRHLRVLVADRSYAMFLTLLPFVLAALVATVPGDVGFDAPTPPSTEPVQLLLLLIIGAAFMGMAASSRDLVGERAIFQREKGVGLATTAYFAAKLAVFALLSVLQSAVLVGLALLLKDPPGAGTVIGAGWLELYVVVAATAFASAVLGLLVSAMVTTTDQVMPLLVVGSMTQLVLCGGLIPVHGRAVLEQLAWLAPSRWGFAAGASTVAILDKVPWMDRDDPLWAHTAGQWWAAMAALGMVTVVAAALCAWRLSRVGAR